MQSVRIIYWEDDGSWLGYLEEYPDYRTQGETLDDLREHLRDLYQDLTRGVIPGIRRAEELVISWSRGTGRSRTTWTGRSSGC